MLKLPFHKGGTCGNEHPSRGSDRQGGVFPQIEHCNVQGIKNLKTWFLTTGTSPRSSYFLVTRHIEVPRPPLLNNFIRDSIHTYSRNYVLGLVKSGYAGVAPWSNN